jgi:type I restriction enzyme S subunit
MVNMGEIFAHERIGDIEMERVQLSEKEIANFGLKKGDLLFARQSLVLSGAGKCSLVHVVDETTTFESHLIRLRLDEQRVNPEFVFYYFLSPLGKSKVQSLVMQVAAAGIRGSELAKLQIPVPSRPEQNRIAGILSAYDELIANNQRRIAVLEQMARALYREWFVYFRAPGVVMNEGEELPEGWDKSLVDEIVHRLPVGKRFDQKTVHVQGSVPVLDQGKSGIIGFHDEEPGVVASEECPVIVFANHTCYQRIIHFPFSTIQNVLPLVSKSNSPRNIYWIHWTLSGLVTFNDYKGHWPELIAKKIILAPVDLCNKFGEHVGPIHRLILKLENTILNLRRTRDLLLPRLMSGRVEVTSEN